MLDSPIKLKYPARPQQESLCEETMQAFDDGKTIVMLEAPTGTGKSYFAMMIMRQYREKIHAKAKFDLLTCTKMLQTQYFEDFDFINNLWGKSNYRCEKYNTDCEFGKDMCDLNKTRCEACPYDEALKNWKSGVVSLTNFHLFDMYAIFVPDILEQRNADVLVIDEAHNFEELFSDFISVSLSFRYLKRFKLPNEKLAFYEKVLKKIDVMEDFITLLEEHVVVDIRAAITEMEELVKSANISNKEFIKLIRDGNGLIDKIGYFKTQYEADPDNWVIERQLNQNDEVTLKAEPVWSAEYLKELVWSRYKHVILMSGTMLDLRMFSELMGVEDDKTHWISIDSPFPLENRPVYYIPVGKMTKDNKEEAFNDMIPYIKKILKKYKDSKGIIHTNTYELSNWISDHIKNERLIFHDNTSKDEALFKHQRVKEPTVLVSPSMTTGVDLKDDLSRFQIILKMPYPSLASKKVKKRLEVKPEWYSWKTVADLVQTYGRSVRSETDYADTFILDASFSTVRQRNIKFIPKFLKDAIIYMKKE